MAGPIFRFSFASHHIHRRMHTLTRRIRQKMTENFTCIHNILCCRTENAQSNAKLEKSAENISDGIHMGWCMLLLCCITNTVFAACDRKETFFERSFFFEGICILSLVASCWPGSCSPLFSKSSSQTLAV